MKLKDYRKLLGRTLEQVAEALRVSAGTVSRWERGESIPSRDEMGRIKTWSAGAVMPNDFYADAEQRA